MSAPSDAESVRLLVEDLLTIRKAVRARCRVNCKPGGYRNERLNHEPNCLALELGLEDYD